MSEKEVALFFNFKEDLFSNIFDTSKTQRARPFPSFSREPHANQDRMAGSRMAISCSLTISAWDLIGQNKGTLSLSRASCPHVCPVLLVWVEGWHPLPYP